MDNVAFATLFFALSALAARLLHYEKFGSMLLAATLLLALALIVGVMTNGDSHR